MDYTPNDEFQRVTAELAEREAAHARFQEKADTAGNPFTRLVYGGIARYKRLGVIDSAEHAEMVADLQVLLRGDAPPALPPAPEQSAISTEHPTVNLLPPIEHTDL